MKSTTVLLIGLLSLASASAAGQSPREGLGARLPGDFVASGSLAGTFQHYDMANQVLRISDADYAVDPALLKLQGATLRNMRQGQEVIFEMSGYDSKGRDVIVGIKAK